MLVETLPANWYVDDAIHVRERAAIFATNFGVMKLVDQSTAGLWVRGYALTGIPSVAVLCWAVMRGIQN